MLDDTRQQFEDYIADLFAVEDDALKLAHDAPDYHDMPQINVKPQDGALLAWLMRSIGARKAVELGTLAGYSGIWMARALPDDGKLYTVEASSKHAEVAHASFVRAGVELRVEILRGDALQMLDKLAAQGPFDFVFIDADKRSYAAYLAWAAEHLRPGGIVAAHNAYRGGHVLNPRGEDDQAMREFLAALASDDRLHGLVIPMGDGMAVGLKK